MPAYFTPAFFTFFEELKLHNDRDWFTANKGRYERDVRDPFLTFIRDLGPKLATVSPRFVADPKPVGGSLFRIFRDTRFSKDKTPYKTAAGAQFRYEGGKDVHGPGWYLHLAPEEVFMGGGLWHPEPELLRGVRAAIVEDPDRWARAKAGLSLGGESAKRVPAGYPADHPHADDLRRKDFVTMREVPRESVFEDDFLDRFVDRCRETAPLMEFLTRSVGLRW